MEELSSIEASDDEAEVAQVHSLHLNMNAIAAHKAVMEAEAARPTSLHCIECGEEIPEQRRQAIPGVQHCVFCKTLAEKR